MTSTYTDDLRITKQGDNDNPNTWGDVVNEQVTEMLVEAISRVAEINVTGSSNIDISSTVANGATDDARHAVLELSGAVGSDIDLIVPSVEKVYAISTSHTGSNVRVIPSGGSTGVTLLPGSKCLLYTKGTNITSINLDGLLAANNLSDVASATTSRTNLGLDALAILATINATPLIDDLIITFAKLTASAIANTAEAQAGTASDKLMTPERTNESIVALNPFGAQLLHIQDQKTSGTSGGSSTISSVIVRDLNQVVTNDITGASLSSNQITLAAGTYYIDASAPIYQPAVSFGNNHRVSLYNVTDTASTLLGVNAEAFSSVQTRSTVSGQFTIAGPKVFELRHKSNQAATDGLGRAGSSGTEVYADLKIWKID